MEKQEFIEKLRTIQSVDSRKHKAYTIVGFSDNQIKFRRQGNSNIEQIPIKELHQFYQEVPREDRTTTKAKQYIKGRKQSPAVAILDKLDTI
jgi:hypothetical protein